jgi:arginyl-tRNA synthetase
VAGPGFLNFRYRDDFVAALPARILAEATAYGHSASGGGERDPRRVRERQSDRADEHRERARRRGRLGARARPAHRRLRCGQRVLRERRRQSGAICSANPSRRRFAEHVGLERAFPEEGYRGTYVRDLAAQLPEAEARAALARPDGARWFRDQALARVVEWQRTDLARYGVTFDRWFHESTLHPEAVERTRTRLVERDVTYRAERPEGVTEAAEALCRGQGGRRRWQWRGAVAACDALRRFDGSRHHALRRSAHVSASGHRLPSRQARA